MNEVNKIIFRRGDFKNEDEFYDRVFKQIRILIENNSVFSFHENPNAKGVYALQFNPAYGDSSYPIWLTGEEILYVSSYARRKSYDEAKRTVANFEEEDDWKSSNNNGSSGPNA